MEKSLFSTGNSQRFETFAPWPLLGQYYCENVHFPQGAPAAETYSFLAVEYLVKKDLYSHEMDIPRGAYRG